MATDNFKTRQMKNIIFVFMTSSLSAAFLSSCGSDEGPSLTGTNTSISDIAGNWEATSAFFSFAGTGPVVETDVVADGGSVSLSIQNNGRFTLIVNVPGRATETTTGQLGFDEDLLTVSYDEDPGEFEYFSIQNTTNTLSISGPAEFDFDGDGTDEAAIVALDFVRA